MFYYIVPTSTLPTKFNIIENVPYIGGIQKIVTYIGLRLKMLPEARGGRGIRCLATSPRGFEGARGIQNTLERQLLYI